ncbi:cyclic nucleotide-binding-like protein [Zopfochytrium polystomum]|nr:cyclic nucleotide-binding-like protein [Zopfochytrium polystomum]
MSCLIFTLGTSRDFQDPWWSSDKVVQELPNKGWRWWSAYTFGVWSALSNTLPVTSSFRPTSVSMQWTFIALAAMNASLSAALTGTVAAFYSVESGSIHARYKKKMDELSEYLAVQNLPKDLKDQMILSIETKYQGKMFDEASILAGLNESLRQELVLHNCRHILESITFLRLPNGDPKLSWKIRRLSTGLRHRVFVRNETLYKRNAHGTSMFLVVEGCASVRLGRINLGTLNPGSYFGEMSVLAPGPRFETVVAVTNMICMELDGATVLSVVAETPEAKRRMNEACAERIQALDELCDNVFRASLFGPGCIIDEFSEGGDIRGDASVGAADAYERGAAVRGAGGHRVSLGEAMSLNRRSLHQTV